MSLDRTVPSQTVTRPDDDVGKPGSPAAGGGRQTGEQAKLTEQGPQGRSDTDRSKDGTGPGRGPAPVGGSSAGQSDQQSTDDRAGKVAKGHYKVEKDSNERGSNRSR